MCLLNGDLGGSLTSPTDFGKLEEEKVLDTGEIIVETKYLKIYDIIINMLHVFANEPYSLVSLYVAYFFSPQMDTLRIIIWYWKSGFLPL